MFVSLLSLDSYLGVLPEQCETFSSLCHLVCVCVFFYPNTHSFLLGLVMNIILYSVWLTICTWELLFFFPTSNWLISLCLLHLWRVVTHWHIESNRWHMRKARHCRQVREWENIVFWHATMTLVSVAPFKPEHPTSRAVTEAGLCRNLAVVWCYHNGMCGETVCCFISTRLKCCCNLQLTFYLFYPLLFTLIAFQALVNFSNGRVLAKGVFWGWCIMNTVG